MRAGDLNSLVTIQQLATGQDAAGQPVTTWLPLATVWANIKAVSGIETVKAGADTSIVRASIRIRRRADVTAAMRVVYGATTYLIKAVLPNQETRDSVDLVCEVIS